MTSTPPPPRPDPEAPLPVDPSTGIATTSAYDLLSRPTLEISDAELSIVITDLRKRRLAYVNNKTPDRPDKPEPAAKTKAAVKTKSERAAITADLLSELGL